MMGRRWTVRSTRRRAAAGVALMMGVAVLVSATAGFSGAAASTVSATVYLQTMDSCHQALGSAQYQIVGSGVNTTKTTLASTPSTVNSAGGCPLQQGNCNLTLITVGCVSFDGLAPGTYQVHEIATPPGAGSNSAGYAPCTGGSACQSQTVNFTVASDGSVQGTVTNVSPDGQKVTYPQPLAHGGVSTYAGTKVDPLVTHNFGLAPPGSDSKAPNECDADADSDDWLTGTPSSHCAFPEANEVAAYCGSDSFQLQFPWSCALAPVTGPPTPTPTPVTCPSPTVSTYNGTTAIGGTSSYFVATSATGSLIASLTWTGGGTVKLFVYNNASTLTLGSAVGTVSPLPPLSVDNLPGATYKVKVQNPTGNPAPISFTLSVTHC
jgi:hypothetical protein